jgi:hypothetical protein
MWAAVMITRTLLVVHPRVESTRSTRQQGERLGMTSHFKDR